MLSGLVNGLFRTRVLSGMRGYLDRGSPRSETLASRDAHFQRKAIHYVYLNWRRSRGNRTRGGEGKKEGLRGCGRRKAEMEESSVNEEASDSPGLGRQAANTTNTRCECNGR